MRQQRTNSDGTILAARRLLNDREDAFESPNRCGDGENEGDVENDFVVVRVGVLEAEEDSEVVVV